jgi:peptide/nickel transport system substrate-binding protein
MNKNRMVKIWLLGGLFILLGICLTACGQATQTAAPQATQAAPTQPVEIEKTITIVIPEDPPSFNAAIADSGYDALVMHMTLLGMAGIDPEGKVYPELAAELPTVENGGVVIDENAGTMDVTWKMRTDVNWADGTPVTAEDVIFTYQAIINPDTGFWIPGIDLVSGVDKIDDHSFVVHFSGIYPSYLTLFGNRQVVIWPAHYCKSEQGFQNWDCGREPLSDGPYTLEEWVTGDHLTFVRNPKYFQPGKPEIDNRPGRYRPRDDDAPGRCRHSDVGDGTGGG